MPRGVFAASAHRHLCDAWFDGPGCRDATTGVADWSQGDSNRQELALLQCDGMPSAVHMVPSCRYGWCALQNWSVLTPCS